MKILITGINGQVGHALMQSLTEHKLIGLTRQDCDLNQTDQIKRVIDLYQPELIINPAAYTMVDQAEDEPNLVFKINRDAPKTMAEKARESNIPFIHFSTDYVFDGEKKSSYCEEDSTNPLGVYGKSKLMGEDAIQITGGQNYIFRTSWVYSNLGHNFFLKMKRLSSERNELKIVSDQIGVPTSSDFIAEQIKKIIQLLSKNNSGIYHLVPNGFCSWYDFAKQIIRQTNPEFRQEKLYPIETNEFPTKAKRPQNCILDNYKIKQVFNLSFNDWSKELEKIIT